MIPETIMRLGSILVIAALAAACASLPPGSDFPKTESSALPHPEQTWLGRRVEARSHAHPGMSGFRLMPLGVDGFLVREQLVNAATRTLDIQYFIFQQDDTGRLLTDAIVRAADRGVRVRVLVDDSQVSARDRRIAVLDAHPNIEVRVFNPFAYRGDAKLFRALEFVGNASRLDYRMHNKLLVVDNAIALAGGRNIGDEYFQMSHGFEFGDYDVFAAGPIVRGLSASFDEFWNSELAIPNEALEGGKAPTSALDNYRAQLDAHQKRLQTTDYARRLATSEPLAALLSGRIPLVWANAQVLYDSPDKAHVADNNGKLIRDSLAKVARAVQSELLIVSPYFVPGKKGMEFFKELGQRKVRVRVLTNSLQSTDVLMVHSAYMHYRVPLLESGVQLYEVRPVLGNPKGSGGSLRTPSAGRFALHAKVMVFDRRKLFIGSMNVDRRSLHLNTEIGLLIDSPALAREVAARFESIARPTNSYVLRLTRDPTRTAPSLVWHTDENGKAIDYDREPARDETQRAKVRAFSLLPLDDEL